MNRSNSLASDAVVGIPVQLESMTRGLTAQQTMRETHHRVAEEGITRLGSGFETIRQTIQTLSSASAAGHVKSHSLLEQNHIETRGFLEQNQLETRNLREQTQRSHLETHSLLEQNHLDTRGLLEQILHMQLQLTNNNNSYGSQ
jgi:hypothetical protein